MPKGLLSKIGGGVSLVSLLFLPLVKGCGANLTGIDVIRAGDVPGGIKFMLIIAVVCAIAVFFLKTVRAFYLGWGGLGGLLAAYTMARQKLPVEMEIGTYLSIIGFGLIIVEGFMQQHKNGGESNQDNGQIKKE